jgi:fermentation-respiration switch protein FrsA (DUF1100 family)
MKTNCIRKYEKLIVVFLVLLSTAFAQVQYSSQDITGQWNGVLSVQGTNLRLVFNINKTGDGYTSTMDSPDQGVKAIPVSNTRFDGSKLSLEVSALGALYEGEFKADSIEGTFRQSGMSFPLTLNKTPAELKPVVRPQEPKPPYPYILEDVSFENKTAGVTLAGTLSMPSTGGNFMAVILITGSGPQNRDGEIMGHKPFLIIADYLTRCDIAVLRYDDRGVAKSMGNFSTATTADFADDAESAVAYLKTRKDINPGKIGLIGHSEGGVIAPIVAARSNDVAFIVMLAGTGLRGDALLLSQHEALSRASGTSEDTASKLLNINAKVFDRIVNAKETLFPKEIFDFATGMKAEIEAVVPEGVTDNYIKQVAAQVSSQWTQYFLRYDPAPVLEKVKCPVLAVNGSRDLQVPAKENLMAISAALKKGGNQNVTVKEYPGLNHLFQESVTGLPTEYASIEQTFSIDVLKDIIDWIIKI